MSSVIFHKINLRCLTIVFVLCTVACAFSQQPPKNNFSKPEVEAFAIEIFQYKNMQLILDTKSKRMQLITRFLEKQYTVNYSPQYRGKKFKLLSDLELNNKYNKSLSTDVYYSPKIYNPLKYMFPMYFIYNEKYRS